MGKCKWDKETCLEEAHKYKSRGEFQKKSRSAYNAALKNGWLDDCTFEEQRKSWDKESCLEEAKKYNSRSEFKKKCR